MRTVTYRFDIDEMVKTPFMDEGIVIMLAFDDGEQKYYVQTKRNSGWFKEKQLQFMA